MAFRFYTNTCISANPLSAACLSSHKLGPSTDWDAANDNPVRFAQPSLDNSFWTPGTSPAFASQITTTATATNDNHHHQPTDPSNPCSSSCTETCQHIRNAIRVFAPNNPTILFSSPQAATSLGARKQGGGGGSTDLIFACTGITIVSSSWTVEVYSQGEYVGTFRGEPTSTLSTGTAELYKIYVDQESLPQKTRAILVKFFIPKKSRNVLVAPSEAFVLHWLVIHGSQQPSQTSSSSSSSSQSTLATATASIAPADLISIISQQQQLPSLPTALSSTGSTIDLEKVREMMGQVQLDSLPQGAKDLMRVMQMQAMSRAMGQNSAALVDRPASLGSTAMGISDLATSSMMPLFPPRPHTLSLATETSSASRPTEPEPSTLESGPLEAVNSLPSTTTPTYVTRAELAQLETRIMDTIDRRLKDLEDRIVDRILSLHRKPAVDGE
ncbi:hypothetical protein BGZ99_001884 [Dissophora globulifera]|uniref:Uncharacterized protein n=1 Tax=Dissophora globulifera TaxID=979702 RepID=A0A9P6RT33_9FUNG|nr:hypothetical protein BGZ99_001884 [Dissophora globulifera]